MVVSSWLQRDETYVQDCFERFDFLTFYDCSIIVIPVARGGFTESRILVPQPLEPEPGNTGGGKRHDCIIRRSCSMAFHQPLPLKRGSGFFLW